MPAPRRCVETRNDMYRPATETCAVATVAPAETSGRDVPAIVIRAVRDQVISGSLPDSSPFVRPPCEIDSRIAVSA